MLTLHGEFLRTKHHGYLPPLPWESGLKVSAGKSIYNLDFTPSFNSKGNIYK